MWKILHTANHFCKHGQVNMTLPLAFSRMFGQEMMLTTAGQALRKLRKKTVSDWGCFREQGTLMDNLVTFHV